jgi:hypothetical protein
MQQSGEEHPKGISGIHETATFIGKELHPISGILISHSSWTRKGKDNFRYRTSGSHKLQYTIFTKGKLRSG